MNSSHPFEFMSPALSDAFRVAGWVPGVSRREAALRRYQSVWRNLLGLSGGRSDEDPYCDPYYVDQQFEVFPTAQVILDQLWGIKVTLRQNGRGFAETVYFSLNLVSGYEDEIRRLSRLLKTELVPIGQRFSREIILISPEEYVFSLSFVAYGVTCDGRGFGNAIERILRGGSQPVLVSRDLDPWGLFEGDFESEESDLPIQLNGENNWREQVIGDTTRNADFENSDDAKLRRFWFKFKLSINDPHPCGKLLGCGVTAVSKDAAMKMVRRVVFRGEPLPLIENIIEDVDLRELDANHVLPNTGDPTRMGIWYPLGYSSASN